jgi:hypothetical protein
MDLDGGQLDVGHACTYVALVEPRQYRLIRAFNRLIAVKSPKPINRLRLLIVRDIEIASD